MVLCVMEMFILTVSKGNVEKYIQITKNVIEEFGVDMYTKQRVDWTAESVDSLFNNDLSNCNDFGRFLMIIIN